MPATPMNDAADKYSPEIAAAFHPTDTDRPATRPIVQLSIVMLMGPTGCQFWPAALNASARNACRRARSCAASTWATT